MNEENLNQAPQSAGASPMQEYKDTYRNDTGKKHNKALVIILAILCPLAVFGIAVGVFLSSQEDEPDKPTPVEPEPFVASDGGTFGLNFLKQAYATDPGNNMVVSPYSMDAVWRLALSGANGETKQEILNTIGARSVSSYPQLKNANGLFIRDTFADYVKPEYVASFEGDLRYDSFSSPDAVNAWVKENTNDMIEKILDEAPNEETVLMLLNAIAMDEKWADEFECDYTSGEDFTTADGQTKTVSMMSGHADRYFKTANAEGVIREYEEYEDGSAFEFVGILPNGSVKEYLEGVNYDEITAMNEGEIEDYSKEDDGSINVVSVHLPRFSFDYSMPKASQVMQNLGINQAFDENTADFSNMVDLTGSNYENFYVGDVLQRARIEMTETGTKAAAVSAIVGYATSAIDTNEYNYYNVEFNRPFVYLIRDKASQEIIFAGVVEMPEEWSGSTCSE